VHGRVILAAAEGIETESDDQKNLVEILKAELPSSLTEGRIEFTLVDALREHSIPVPFPCSWKEWQHSTKGGSRDPVNYMGNII
jgi:hypothetical protein